MCDKLSKCRVRVLAPTDFVMTIQLINFIAIRHIKIRAQEKVEIKWRAMEVWQLENC